MNTITIREMEKGDLAKVASIYSLYQPEQKLRYHLMSRMEDCVNKTPEMIASKFTCFVAEKDGKVIGFAGMRKVPAHMSHYLPGEHGCELYILAAETRNHGVGKALIQKVIQAGKEEKYTDLILYSGETHRESYSFYDHLGFEKIADSIAPDGEKGVIYRIRL